MPIWLYILKFGISQDYYYFGFFFLFIFYLWLSSLSVFTLGLDDIFSWLIFILYINYLAKYYVQIFLNKH